MYLFNYLCISIMAQLFKYAGNMLKGIKYCLLGAIFSGFITVTLNYFGVLPMISILFKVVYLIFTIALLYFVIRLLATAESVKEGS